MADDLLTLVCPLGQDTHSYPICSHDRSFDPYREDPRDPSSRWLVDVTPAAAEHLLHKGGFALANFVQRRHLSGQKTPLVHADGPFALSFDGEEHHSEETVMPNGAMFHVMAFPSEGVGDVVGVHPGVSVLSLADFTPPEPAEGEGGGAAKGRRGKREASEQA